MFLPSVQTREACVPAGGTGRGPGACRRGGQASHSFLPHQGTGDGVCGWGGSGLLLHHCEGITITTISTITNTELLG